MKQSKYLTKLLALELHCGNAGARFYQGRRTQQTKEDNISAASIFILFFKLSNMSQTMLEKYNAADIKHLTNDVVLTTGAPERNC